VGRYESIDHDDPLEVAKLSTVLPQVSIQNSIANYYDMLCTQAEIYDAFAPEVEASSLLLSHFSFDPAQYPLEKSDISN